MGWSPQSLVGLCKGTQSDSNINLWEASISSGLWRLWIWTSGEDRKCPCHPSPCLPPVSIHSFVMKPYFTRRYECYWDGLISICYDMRLEICWIFYSFVVPVGTFLWPILSLLALGLPPLTNMSNPRSAQPNMGSSTSFASDGMHGPKLGNSTTGDIGRRRMSFSRTKKKMSAISRWNLTPLVVIKVPQVWRKLPDTPQVGLLIDRGLYYSMYYRYVPLDMLGRQVYSMAPLRGCSRINYPQYGPHCHEIGIRTFKATKNSVHIWLNWVIRIPSRYFVIIVFW